MARERQMLELRLMLSQAISPMVMEVMEVTDVATTERGRLMLRLDTTVDTPEDMEVMEVTDVATTERGKLMLRLDIPEDMEDMDMEAMVVMDVATMERGRLKLRLDTPEDMEDMDMVVMVAMDVDTMARGKLMLNPAMVVMDMVVMAVHMEVMVDMVIAVEFLPLFIISPPHH